MYELERYLRHLRMTCVSHLDLLACALHLSGLRVLRCCSRVRLPSTVCVICDAARECVAPQLSVCAMLLACASPISCLRELRCCLRVHRPSTVCLCCGAACVCIVPHLSAMAAVLLAGASSLSAWDRRSHTVYKLAGRACGQKRTKLRTKRDFFN